MTDHLEYVRLRAPQDDGCALQVPPLSEAPSLWSRNAERLNQAGLKIEGLSAWRDYAQQEVIASALEYTRSYRDIDDSLLERQGLVLAGHQPQLYHPGVWYKNFVLHALGERLDAVPINLIVDNDVCASTAIRVPGGTKSGASFVTVELDDSFAQVPYECRPVVDDARFHTFGSRVREALTDEVEQPVINALWEQISDLDSVPWLGQRVAAARHRLEGRWGQQTLELPLSRACRTESFAQFFAGLVREAGRLRDVYNEALADYRRIHRVRSRSHPVPALAETDGWIETPFWVYRQHMPHRERLFVRATADRFDFSDLAGWASSCSPESIDRWFLETSLQGEMIRPRALITTWFSRLVLGQVFLHGIGGAKYDQLTDEIIRRFWGIEPPEFMTLTATFRLPIERPNVFPSDVARLRQNLRELRYHPEHHLDHDHSEIETLEQWAQQKREWVDPQARCEDRRTRHEQIEACNRAMQPGVEQKRQLLEQELVLLKRLVRHSQLSSSREFSFCLFPEGSLRQKLEQLSQVDA